VCTVFYLFHIALVAANISQIQHKNEASAQVLASTGKNISSMLIIVMIIMFVYAACIVVFVLQLCYHCKSFTLFPVCRT